ncbi:hypothetical protein C8R41DRAFT_915441 [Lentinula lateritia]|uniref:Uncharacterized protein n=1 Tax=Lentinula lateritia TaxID=40482 RepID=A0ABQ8VS97_9AGAR|nr:hypothetical protein C8R41DRAFT_915441 [Lentinula lateritia]
MNPTHSPQKTRVTHRQKPNSKPSRHPMSLRRRTRALVPVAAGPSTATSDPSTATSDPSTATSDPSTVTSNPSTAVSDPGFSNTHSTPVILMQQARTLNLLNEKVASLEEARQLLEDELKEETLL